MTKQICFLLLVLFLGRNGLAEASDHPDSVQAQPRTQTAAPAQTVKLNKCHDWLTKANGDIRRVPVYRIPALLQPQFGNLELVILLGDEVNLENGDHKIYYLPASHSTMYKPKIVVKEQNLDTLILSAKDFPQVMSNLNANRHGFYTAKLETRNSFHLWQGLSRHEFQNLRFGDTLADDKGRFYVINWSHGIHPERRTLILEAYEFDHLPKLGSRANRIARIFVHSDTDQIYNDVPEATRFRLLNGETIVARTLSTVYPRDREDQPLEDIPIRNSEITISDFSLK